MSIACFDNQPFVSLYIIIM